MGTKLLEVSIVTDFGALKGLRFLNFGSLRPLPKTHSEKKNKKLLLLLPDEKSLGAPRYTTTTISCKKNIYGVFPTVLG